MNKNQIRNRQRYAEFLLSSMLEGNEYLLKDSAYADAQGISPLPNLVAIKTNTAGHKTIFYVTAKWVRSTEELLELFPYLENQNEDRKGEVAGLPLQATHVYAVVIGKGKILYVNQALKSELAYDETTIEVHPLEQLAFAIPRIGTDHGSLPPCC